MPGVLATSVPLAVVLFVQLTGVLLREEFMPWAPVAMPLVVPTPEDPEVPLALPPLLLLPLLLPLPMALSPLMGVELHAASVNAMTLPKTRLEIAVFIIAPVSLICAHDLSIYCMYL
jgi:hypothetical protein